MEQNTPLQISFENLSYAVKVRAKNNNRNAPTSIADRLKNVVSKKRYEDKVILNGLSGTFQPGRVTAILGPSGSGKTTLLNLLAGHESSGTVSGDIWVNGRSASGASIRQLAGYVNQDDVILSTQTVREAIDMSITLRPPPLSSLPPQSPDTAVGSIREEAHHQSEPNADAAEKGLLPLPVTAEDKGKKAHEHRHSNGASSSPKQGENRKAD
ncbi:hypothetical protein GGF43_001531, partial [Coemansia sp. RSA 2618]